MHPETYGRFEIEELIGEGGMGSVFAARDTDSGERVALKVLSSEIAEDEEKLRRFEQEVAALSRIEHEGIVRRLGPIERDGNRIFFPMELLEGDTLSRRLRDQGPMPVPVALGIARALLRALGAAHAAGVVHRDIKPSNILLVGDSVKVTDFGLARMDDITRLTKTGQLMGTLDYMSPEQCEGAGVGERSDLYSVGIVFYEMLAGAPPFRNQSPGAVLKGHLQDVPPRADKLRSDLPEGLAFVIAKLLEKNPEDRYATAEETLEALEGVRDPSRTVSFHPGSGPTVPEMPAPPREPRRPPWRMLAVAAAAVLVAAGAFVAVRALQGERYPGRGSPEDLLETVHRAIEGRDYRTFAECLEEEALLEYLSEEPERTFRDRAGKLVAYAYRADVPPRGWSGRQDVSMRIVSGVALPAVLGRRSPLVVALRHGAGGFRVAQVFDDRGPGRRNPMGEFTKREQRAIDEKIAEVLGSIEKYGPALVDLIVKEGRLPEEKTAALRAAFAKLSAKGRIEYRVLHDQSKYDFRRSTVVLESKDLARAFGSRGKRVALELQRRGRGGPWQITRIRPQGR